MMIMNDDNDHVPDGVAADDDDHNVDAHSGDQNLALSDQFLNERMAFELEEWDSHLTLA